MSWTLEEGIEYCKELENHLSNAKIGYHCALTGSVLYTGSSIKDLDVMIYPHDTENCKPVEEVKLFISKLNDIDIQQIDRLKYPDKKDVCWGTLKNDKRVDYFFVR